MTLPSSPPISLLQVINNYFGPNNLISYYSGAGIVASGISNGTGVLIPNTGTISLSSFYGAFTPSLVTLSTPVTNTTVSVPSGASNVTAGITGGGGGGGGSNTVSHNPGGGGGAGAWANTVINVNAISNVTCTVGTGGSGGGIGASGTDGTPSNIGVSANTLLPTVIVFTCGQGLGGTRGGLTTNGVGGVGGTSSSNATANIAGQNGANGTGGLGGGGGNTVIGLFGTVFQRSGGDGGSSNVGSGAGTSGIPGFIMLRFT